MIRNEYWLIEDDEEMRSLLKDFIEEEGFETDSVE